MVLVETGFSVYLYFCESLWGYGVMKLCVMTQKL